MTAVRIPTDQALLGAVRLAGEAAWTPSRIEVDADGSTLRLSTPMPPAGTDTKGAAMLPTEHGIAAARFELPAGSTVPRLVAQPPVLLNEVDIASPPHAMLAAAGRASAAVRLEVNDVTITSVERNSVQLDLGRRRRADELGVLRIGAGDAPQNLLVELVKSVRGERAGSLVGIYRLADPEPVHQRALDELVIRMICQGAARIRRSAA